MISYIIDYQNYHGGLFTQKEIIKNYLYYLIISLDYTHYLRLYIFSQIIENYQGRFFLMDL